MRAWTRLICGTRAAGKSLGVTGSSVTFLSSASAWSAWPERARASARRRRVAALLTGA